MILFKLVGVQFRTESLIELDENSTEALLTGATYDDISVTGTDSVKIVAKKK